MKACKVCKNEIASKFASTYCSNKCKFSDPDYNRSRIRVREKLDKSKKVICKVDGKEFFDIDNRSGVLSRHLKSLNVAYEKVMDYYDLADNTEKEVETWKCKYCDWKTRDLRNQSGCVTIHLKSKHGVTPTQHVSDYPEDRKMWTSSTIVTNKDIRSMLFEENFESYVECKICGEKLKRVTVTHLSLHGISVEEYRRTYDLEGVSISSLEFSSKMRENYYEKYEHINKISKTSSHEKEICDFLYKLGIEHVTSDRKTIFPHELDIYVPSKRVAIEINGLYWHSEMSGNKLKDYHLNKTVSCEKQGIHLIQIFDDEWRNKKEIIKSKVVSILGLQDKKVYARDCEIRVIGSKQKREFLKKYHIQSDDRCKYAYALFYEEEIACVMTFCELRAALGQKKKQGHYELSRYCSSVRVVGGASKLLSKFILDHSPEKIITYADRRFTCSAKDTMYEKLGFTRVHFTKPNYWYTKDYSQKYHRYNFTKGSIIKKYGLDQNKTEFALMEELGYDRVWDCGNIKYEMTPLLNSQHIYFKSTV